MAKMHFTVEGTDGTKHKETAIVPDRTPNPGTANIKRRTIEAEVKAKWLSGRQHNKSIGSGKKFGTSLKHFSSFMHKYEGVNVLQQVKQENIDHFIHHLKNNPSDLWQGKTEKFLSQDNISDIIGDARKILWLVGNEDFLNKTYAAMGLETNVKNPLKFDADHAQKIAEHQYKLNNSRCKWAGAIYQVSEAFGGRTASIIVSKDMLYRDGDQLYAQKDLSKFQKVTMKALQQRYGNTFKDRLQEKDGSWQIKDKEKQYICMDEKGARNGVKAVNTPGREAAIERLQREILANPKHAIHKSPIPDKINPEKARESFKKLMARNGAGRGSKINIYGNRHWNAQRVFDTCMKAGMTIKQAGAVVTIELGHDPGSENYLSYVDVSKYK